MRRAGSGRPWAFVGDDADHAIFASNRSGAYQWYLLEIPAARLVQLTAGQKISPNMACVARSGRPRASPPPGLARHLVAHPGQPRPSELQPGRSVGGL